MTPLNKPVRRVTVHPHRGRLLVAALEPGDVLTLRQKGRRAVEELSLAWCYDQAVIRRVMSEKAAKAAARKAKREGRG